MKSAEAQQAATQALAGQQTYREHLHRGLMLPLPAEDHRLSGIGQAFWPTRRDVCEGNPIGVPIVNCQRCGHEIAPTAGWWCRECSKIVPLLQCYRGMSMVQIAAMGEGDPPSVPQWVYSLAPWLAANRPECMRPHRYECHEVDTYRRLAARQNTKRSRSRGMMPRVEQVWVFDRVA